MMIRRDWVFDEAMALFAQPFNDLLLDAQLVHRQHFQRNEIQLSALMNVKAGGCPENCCYCAQSAHYNTGLQKKKLASTVEVREAVKRARSLGASRFCFAAAWRSLHDKDVDHACQLVQVIKSEGLESCASLGMLKLEQAQRLKASGLDFYNHNVDTSMEFYHNIVTTRTYEERLSTIRNVLEAGINLCCGGILGMGESTEDRAKMLVTLANLEKHPLSVPINRLVPMQGTPLYGKVKISNIDFIRTIAVARIMMPASYIRLAAGRGEMSEEMQVLCVFAGANSVFCGEKLLTAPNTVAEDDEVMFSSLGNYVSLV